MFLGILLVFLSIFMFKIPYFRDSLVVASLISLFYITLNHKIRDMYSYALNLRPLHVFLFLISCISFVASLVIIFWGVNDVTFLYSKILQVFYIVLLIPVVFLLYNLCFSEKDVCLIIIFSFVIQSIIQFVAILSPVFADVIYYFQYESAREIASSFGGVRGNALSGNLFFGLAASYGLCIMLCGYYLSRYDTQRFVVSCSMIVIILGSFLVGRTAFIGVLFAVVLFFIVPNEKFRLFQRFSIFFLSLLSILLILAILFIFSESNSIGHRIFNFAFELILNLVDGQGLQTKSTNRLLEMLTIDTGNIFSSFFGQGLYTGFDGKYFMRTDSGYLRGVLFFGIFGTLLMTLSFFFYCLSSLSKRFKYEMKDLILPCSIFLYCAVVQVKGEVFFHMHMLSVMIMLLLVAIWNSQSNYETRQSHESAN